MCLIKGALKLGDLFGGVVHDTRGHIAHRVQESAQSALAAQVLAASPPLCIHSVPYAVNTRPLLFCGR